MTDWGSVPQYPESSYGVPRPRVKRKPSTNVRDRFPVERAGQSSTQQQPSGVQDSRPLDPVLVVSDVHRPYHSRAGWDLLMQVGRAIRPKHIVIIGDFADFYSVSAHDKNPERAHRFDEELADVEQGLDELDSLGATDKLYIEGNHEDRLRRYLMKSPELSGRRISTPALLHLAERGWEFVEYRDHAKRGAIHYTHDVGVAGRNAAFKALETYQHSVVTGHNHRLAYVVEGSATGECKLSATFGWLGDVESVDYMNRARARKEWALGFGVGYVDGSSGYTYLAPIPIVYGTCCVNGIVYRSSL